MSDLTTRRGLAMVLAFSLVSCLLNLGGHRLTSMEPMVIDGARHMLAHGQWATPHLYGEMFMFKPPLALWMSAVPLALWENPSESLLRLPFALAGVALGLALFGLFTRAAGPRLGLITALCGVGSVQFVEKVRIAQYEMPLAAGVGIAVAAAVINLSGTRERTSLWLLAYAALGLGFLAKGVPALMAFGPGLLAAAFLSGGAGRLLGWRHLSGCALGGLIIGGYLLWAYATAGPESFLQAAAEARTRAVGWDGESLTRTLAKPAVIWICFLPWSFALLLWPRFREVATPDRRRMANAALGFAAGGLVAFLIVPTYEPRYYLPLVTSFAVLSAVILEALHDRRIGLWALLGGRAVFSLALTLLAAAGIARGSASWALVLVTFIVASAAAFLPANGAPRGRELVRVLVATSLLCAFGQALITVPARAHKRDLTQVARELRPHLEPGETLWMLGPADCAARVGNLLHYLGRPVLTVAHPARTRPGTTVLLVEPQSSRLPDDLDYTVLERASHPRFDFTLIRVGDGGLRQRGQDRRPRERRVGDLCRARYRKPVAEDPAAELDYNLGLGGERLFFAGAGG